MIMFFVTMIIVLSPIVLFLLRQSLFAKLYRAMSDADLYFEELIDRPLVKALFSRYVRENLTLNYYIHKKDEEGVRHQFNKLLKLPLDQNQENAVLLHAFDYYHLDGKKCDQIVARMDESIPHYQSYVRYVNIVFHHDDHYVTELKKELSEHRGLYQGTIYYLLALSSNSHKKEDYLQKAAVIYNTTIDQLPKLIKII